jgi:hypothetical protein
MSKRIILHTGDIAMNEDIELVRGSDNPFEDVGLPEANAKLTKAGLAA